MSAHIEQQRAPEAEPAGEQPEMLVFAAASIVRELATQAGAQPVRELVSNERRYRLEGHKLHTLVDGAPIVLVFVEPMAGVLPDDAELRRRFGLTRKEASVARLLAEDQSNEQIATRLSISPHTARHHTERILAKLGARSRTQVRGALAGSAG